MPDTFQGSTPFITSPKAPLPCPMTSHWDPAIFSNRVRDYPYQAVCRWAIDAMSERFDPFRGRRDVARDFPDRAMSEDDRLSVRAHLMKECEAKRVDGPRKTSPFKHASLVPYGKIRKHRYVPDGS